MNIYEMSMVLLSLRIRDEGIDETTLHYMDRPDCMPAGCMEQCPFGGNALMQLIVIDEVGE